MRHTTFLLSMHFRHSLIELTLVLDAGSTAVVLADENNGFVEGATATLNLRNAYINRNFVNPSYPTSATQQNMFDEDGDTDEDTDGNDLEAPAESPSEEA